MALAAGRGRAGSPGRWAVEARLAEARSPLKPFVAAGCSFLHPSLRAFTVSPDRKPPVPHPHRGAGSGEQKSSLGGAPGAKEAGGLGWEFGSPPATDFTSTAAFSVRLDPRARAFWALVFSSLQWARRCASDAFGLWAPKADDASS